MYLDRSNNRGKQDLSLYDVKKEGFELNEEFLQYNFYPTRKDFSEIKVEVKKKSGNYDQIVQTIYNRGKAIINDFVTKIYS